MENLIALMWLWFVHAAVAAPVVIASVIFTRRTVVWHWWETLTFIVPFGLWLGLLFSSLRPKSLGNLGECFFITIAIAIASPLRAYLGRSKPGLGLPLTTLAGVSLVAVASYFLSGVWPE
jgi:hypothetical protein